MRQEDAMQEAVAEFLDLKRVLWTHVPNEGRRTPREGARLKRAGLKRGVPDILIFEQRNGFTGLAIELKTQSGKLSKEQRTWLHELACCGWFVDVCRSTKEAIESITGYFKGEMKGIRC